MKRFFCIIIPILLLFAVSPFWCSAATCTLQSAIIYVNGDDDSSVWINGHYIGAFTYVDGSSPNDPVSMSVPIGYLNATGNNVIAIAVTDTAGGSIFGSYALDVTCVGGMHSYITSNEGGIKISATNVWNIPPPNDAGANAWNTLDFDDTAWANAVAVTATTWAKPLYSPADGRMVTQYSYDATGFAGANQWDPSGMKMLYMRKTFVLNPVTPPPSPTITIMKSASQTSQITGPITFTIRICNTGGGYSTKPLMISDHWDSGSGCAWSYSGPWYYYDMNLGILAIDAGATSFTVYFPLGMEANTCKTFEYTLSPCWFTTDWYTAAWCSSAVNYSSVTWTSGAANTSVAFTMYCPSNTSTPAITSTFTRTSTPSMTASYSPTFTVTRSNTPSPTVSSSQTSSATMTKTLTFTPTFTMTVSTSFTATPPNTATNTLTRTSTFTPSCTPSNTMTVTVTFTRTATPTATITTLDTSTATPTRTPINTPSPTFTASGTYTQTQTFTPSITSTATKTATSTDTATPSITITSLDTATVTYTITMTFTATNTFTLTPSYTVTLTGTPTITKSATPSITITSLDTATFTQTYTRTSTSMPTGTLTNSPSYTDTLTVTETLSRTNTPTTTLSATAMPTLTITATPAGATALLEIEITSRGDNPGPGAVVTYRIKITNNDTTPAYNIKVWDTLPDEMYYGQTQSADLPEVNGNYLQWSLPNGFILNPGEETTIIFTAIITNIEEGSLVINTASVDYNDGQYNTPDFKHPALKSEQNLYPEGIIVVFPNPFDSTLAVGGKLKFANMVPGALLQIYTLTGELVYSVDIGQNVKYFWNCKNRDGKNISPGIYFWVVKNPVNGRTDTGKLFIVR